MVGENLVAEKAQDRGKPVWFSRSWNALRGQIRPILRTFDWLQSAVSRTSTGGKGRTVNELPTRFASAYSMILRGRQSRLCFQNRSVQHRERAIRVIICIASVRGAPFPGLSYKTQASVVFRHDDLIAKDHQKKTIKSIILNLFFRGKLRVKIDRWRVGWCATGWSAPYVAEE